MNSLSHIELPPPLTEAEMSVYSQCIASLDYDTLIRTKQILDLVYTHIEPTLALRTSSHPINQQRLLLANEVYRRATLNPTQVANWHKYTEFTEGAVAGAVVGAIIGVFTSEPVWFTTLAGAAIGGFAMTNSLMHNIFTRAVSGAVL